MVFRLDHAALLVACCLPAMGDDNWPQWRGPTQQGHADASDVPLNWSETQGIRFKTAIPGQGWSSPVIWSDQVWMTTATEHGHSLRAICIDRNTGGVLHDIEVFHVKDLPRKNAFNSYASPSPIIEEGRLYVCFGAMGSACLDTATGNVLWRNEDLKVEHWEGPGSTPIIYRNFYILNCDGGDVQYVVALDKHTGKSAWKTPRSYQFSFYIVSPFRKSFSTPIVVPVDGQDQLISVGTRRACAYDPMTGKELWFVDLDDYAYSIAPRPVSGDGLIYICTGYNKAELWAINPSSASGDITKTHVAWKFKQGVPFKPSLLFHDGLLYFVSDNGIARCLDAKTGTQVWQKRLAGNYSASPTLAGGRIYFFNEEGLSTSLKPGRQFEPLAENELEDGCLATPAFTAGAIFIRTRTHLYKVVK